MTWKPITAALLLAGMLAAEGPLVAAEAEVTAAPSHKRCTQGTIQGRFGYYGQGEIVPNDIGVPPGPFVSLGTATFDGAGSFRWTSSDLPGLPLTGTYALRRDCTGTIIFEFPGTPIPPSSANIIVVDDGNELFIAGPPVAGNPFVALFVYKRQ